MTYNYNLEGNGKTLIRMIRNTQGYIVSGWTIRIQSTAMEDLMGFSRQKIQRGQQSASREPICFCGDV